MWVFTMSSTTHDLIFFREKMDAIQWLIMFHIHHPSVLYKLSIRQKKKSKMDVVFPCFSYWIQSDSGPLKHGAPSPFHRCPNRWRWPRWSATDVPPPVGDGSIGSQGSQGGVPFQQSMDHG
jgi:hypothetical protein